MSFASYAQNYEDLRLWRALGDIERGCYLDVGAQHPVMDSVSKAFYDAGWRGAHVEPTPVYAAALRENRPDEPVFEVAIGGHAGPMMLYDFPDTGMSTGVAEIARLHSEAGFEVRLCEVPVVPLSKVFADFGAKTIHWMKIDVEGMERDVIASWGRSSAKPWVLVIESVHPSSHAPSEGEWIDLVLARGYREVAFDGLSRYFVADDHSELARALATPPNIFDDFRVTRYHFSSQRVAAEYTESIETLQRELAEAQAQSSAGESHAAELQAAAAALAEERANSQAATVALVAEQANSQAATAALAEERANFQAATAALAEERAISQATTVALAEERANSQAVTAVLAEERANSQAAMSALAEERANLAAVHAEFDRVTEMLKSAEAMIVDLTHARAGLEARLSDAETQASARGAELDAARAAIGQKDDLARTAQVQLADAMARHEQANARARALHGALLADYAEAKRSRDQLQEMLDDLRSRQPSSGDAAISALDVRLAALEDQNRIMAQSLEAELARCLTSSHETLEAGRQDGGSVADAATHDILTSLDTESAPMTLDDLLEFHDEQFVKWAYRLVLNRHADRVGLWHYTRRLRRGGSRIRVLADLARSAEGREVGAQVPGLRKAIRHQRVRDLIRLHPLSARLFGDYREDDVITRLRAIENRLGAVDGSDPITPQQGGDLSQVVVAADIPAPVPTIIEVARQPQEAPPPLPIVTLQSDRMLTAEQWPAVTQGIFERHWPNHQARFEAAAVNSSEQLWIIVAGEPSSTVSEKTVTNLRALRDAAPFDVELGLLGPKMSLGAKTFASIQDLAKDMPPDSLVLFIGPFDQMDIRLLTSLVLDQAWEHDFVLSDQTYEDNGRVGLVPFHGIDHYHLAHVDYFWSRFLVSGKALREAAKSGAKTLIEVSRGVVSALNGKNGKLLHLQFPFIGNGALDIGTLRQSRHAVMQHLANVAPPSKPGWQASVSVMISTKDGGYLLDALVNQLLAMPQVAEILVVSNNSSSDYTLDVLDRLSRTERCSVFKYDQPFNFSVQNNLAAREAKGRFLLILNDDIALIGADWLDRLLENVDVDRPRIAGPLMLYPDQSIQHGGMYLGFNNTAGHTFRHQKHPHEAPMYELVAPRLVSCLTGACLLMKRSVFDDLNGFDEQLATGLQDVDLSLRAMYSGVELLFDPRSIIFHLESVSLIPTLTDESVQRRRDREYARFRDRWHSELRPDRWHNRNFYIEDETLRTIRIAD